MSAEARLVAFLKARLAEQEVRARALPAGPWEWRQSGPRQGLVGSRRWVIRSGPDGIDRTGGLDDYLQDIQPERMLADVAAKRRIIEKCEPPLVDVRGLGDSEPQFIHGEGPPWGLDVLKLLALPYADHPDYDESWRP